MPILEELLTLLTTPSESLNVEHKGWLDLRNNEEHKAALAKAAIALANEGGGHIVLGIREQRPDLISEPRPAEIVRCDQDTINQIVRRFATPAFQCTLSLIAHPTTAHEHAIITVPGGFPSPVMSKSGTPGRTILPHLCYMRKPGPESAPPETPADWDRLLARCLRNRREDLLDAIRAIVQGRADQLPATATDTDRQGAFADHARDRWRTLIEPLPADADPRCPHGRYEIDFALLGADNQPTLGALLGRMKEASKIKLTGWSPFWIPTRSAIAPSIVDDQIECWQGVPEPPAPFDDAAHSDFWRVSHAGRAFLLRGYNEDSRELVRIEPGTVIDVTLPVWRIGEALLYAARLGATFGDGLSLFFRCHYYGLAGRRLTSVTGRREVAERAFCRQDEIALQTTVPISRIAENLPEILHPLLAPLYERFGFWQLPVELVAQELAEMRRNRF